MDQAGRPGQRDRHLLWRNRRDGCADFKKLLPRVKHRDPRSPEADHPNSVPKVCLADAHFPSLVLQPQFGAADRFINPTGMRIEIWLKLASGTCIELFLINLRH